ncbi:hypothetical protein D3875_04885 [Deinococcus cavernae]|uniref:Uncharacterized protein n=1 Tax=Deinococcus cavernae TaxID=2320857 RepID=A0A418V4H4_9DEIO|nr:hypothetical protein [Deinococcus cavernae]RJF71016.1 hypothetical protein D3875_04885 [Deinococcus cavernae]
MREPAHPDPVPPLLLPAALALPLGRGTLLDAGAEAQLCPAAGSLATQLARLHDDVGEHLHRLTGTRPDLPRRKPHPWTVLTEREHPAWPLMALGHPPVIAADSTPHLVRHLATAHLAMDAARCHHWAADTHARDGYEPLRRSLPAEQQGTWAGVSATVLTVQAQHAMLHGWGVLSAYVGLHHEWRQHAARQILSAVTTQPDLLNDPSTLAATTLWATLSLLHGDLPRPPGVQVGNAARALRSLPEHTVTAPLPNPSRLCRHLQALLPGLTDQEFGSLADHLYGQVSTSPETTLRHTSGQLLTRAPGHTAYWLRRAGQVQVITVVSAQDAGGLDVRAWHWNL